jgi:hypothetical protein
MGLALCNRARSGKCGGASALFWEGECSCLRENGFVGGGRLQLVAG